MSVETADVCLILEGTYPYVRGGVSSWVHALIEGLPDLTFSLLALSPTRTTQQDRKYPLPPNVRAFAEVFLHELTVPKRSWLKRPNPVAWAAFERVHRASNGERAKAMIELFDAVGEDATGLTADDVLFSRRGWQFMVERYQAHAAETSFIDWAWTWRAVHAPLFQTLAAEIPPARLYHPVSTGYAGLLGAIAKARTGSPLLLTEHGIYVRERMIDIARADWIYEEPVRLRAARRQAGPLKSLWTDSFVTAAQVTYELANRIVSLFEANQALQHQLGADKLKTCVIPNGVSIERFAPLASQRDGRPRPLRVGFVGRVVPIKDVKTLLRAFKLVVEELPGAELWIVGPTDEDRSYFEDCKDLSHLLGLRTVTFTGPKDVRTIYPEIDVMVLTSLSEGQPLTILEAACAGVPSVATDVGDCRALVEGRSAADRGLGPCGVITRMGDPADTARAIVRILRDGPLRAAMGKAGVTRATRYYRDALVLERYRALYGALIARQPIDVDVALAPTERELGTVA
jgi:glycosyltransferase involved in cell wall biosynthesis